MTAFETSPESINQDACILVIEDHEIVRNGLVRLIDSTLRDGYRHLEIIEAGSFSEARSSIEQRRDHLDLILLDLELPDASLQELVAEITGPWQGLPITIVSAHEDWKLGRELLRIGLLGFIPKKCNINIMRQALKLNIAGGRYFPDEIFQLFEANGSESFNHRSNIASEDTSAGINQALLAELETLPPRQKEVLLLMQQGLSNKEIARDLGLSIGTTKNYVASILRLLGVSSRVKAIRSLAISKLDQRSS